MLKKAPLVAAVLGLSLSGCGGGGGSADNTNDDGEILSGVSVGYALPTEISAVPADSGGDVVGVQTATGLMTRIRALVTGVAVDALSDDSDYKKASTRKYVEERALEQFDIIEQVMNAAAQTNYADEENVNAGPYKAMIAWVDEGEGGREIKTLEPWVVDSRMIVLDGQDVNRVMVWIEEPDFDNPGATRLVKAEFKIFSAAAVNADGSYANYGEWDLNVSFDESGQGFFAASSRIDGDVNTIMLHEAGTGPSDGEIRGILVRSGAEGHGKVAYPDWEACFGPGSDPDNCTPPTKAAQYAYNADYVVIDADINDGGAVDPIYKDRDPANAVEMTRRYGLFYADAGAGHAAGANVEKSKSFGFPVSYTDGNGVRNFAYYGAWQGRHQLWGNGGSGAIAAGTEVTRQDRGPDQTAETYTVSDPFNGTLTKRTLVDGALTDIQGIAVETWINKHYDLFNVSSVWKSCSNGWVNWFDPNNPQCMDYNGNAQAFSDFSDFESLVVAENDRKNVNINRWDQIAQQPVDYVYLASDPGNGFDFTGGPGFYVGQRDNSNGRMTPVSPAQLYTPQNGDNMGINIGGSIYIQYTGDFTGGATGWVQKTLSSFDEQTWTPEFDPAGDHPFSPEVGREYYINSRGGNYVVKRKDPADADTSYEVMVELQTAANPVNVASLLPADTAYLRTPWRPEVKFAFVSDSADVNFMKLVYLTDDPNTPDDESATPTVYTNGEWGLKAYSAHGTPGDDSDDQPLMADGTLVAVDQYGFSVDPNQRPVEFNWEYSSGDNGWGVQTYLLDGNGDYVLLSDPVQLQPVTLTNGAGASKTLALQFDGWMHGMPDLYFELSKNDWQMSQDISDKVINIPADTAVTDAADDSIIYYVKPLEISVFLAEVPSNTLGVPDISDADAVDLADVPDYVAHGIGDMPEAEVKYSEGKPVNGGV